MSVDRGTATRTLCFCVLLGLGPAIAACSPTGTAIGAGAAVGVTAAQERGVQGAILDARIRVEINYLWFQESDDLFMGVNLQVQEARVLLTGQVPDPETRVRVVQLTWQVPGVSEVINEIAIADSSSLADQARDHWIAARLKAKLLVDKRVSSINYSIETVNRAVYLMGVAQNQVELDRVIAHAKDISYVRRVVNYVRLKDDPARPS